MFCPRIFQFLPSLHQGICTDCTTTELTHKEDARMEVGTQRATSLQQAQEASHRRTCPCTSRPHPTIRSQSRCIRICSGCHTSTMKRRWKETSHWILLSHPQQNTEKLQHTQP